MGDPFSARYSALCGLVWLVTPALAEAPRETEVENLRKAWHACVQEAFAARPATADRRAAQRSALTACKASENALVAAELALQDAEEARRKGGLTARARAWMASMAGTIVDPVVSWVSGSGR